MEVVKWMGCYGWHRGTHDVEGGRWMADCDGMDGADGVGGCSAAYGWRKWPFGTGMCCEECGVGTYVGDY